MAAKKNSGNDLFSRRKPTPSKARRAGQREAKKVVLIVTEDSKSSLLYFRQLAKNEFYRLSMDVRAMHGGQLPNMVDCLSEQANAKEVFDAAFLVFDGDVFHPAHPSNISAAQNFRKEQYDSACQTLAELKKRSEKHIQMIRSVPCFEIWVWMHIEQCTQPFTSTGGKTSGQNCTSMLNLRFKERYSCDYDKASNKIYDILSADQASAVRSSKTILNAAWKAWGGEIPQEGEMTYEHLCGLGTFSEMHVLIEELLQPVIPVQNVS
jgi:hypothetical protein